MWPYNRTPYNRRPGGVIFSIATVLIETESGVTKSVTLGGEAVIDVETESTPVNPVRFLAEIVIETESGIDKFESLLFHDDPTVSARGPLATRVTVKSDTDQYTATVEGIEIENRIERVVHIDIGDEEICQKIAEELLERWKDEQLTVTGDIDLTVTLRFREKVLVKVPAYEIDEMMILQRKEHDIEMETTRVTVGDLILDESELISRILEGSDT